MWGFLRALGKSEHERIQEQLSAYLDGQLSVRDRAAVERHMGSCRECARDLATLRWTVSLVREVPAVPLPRSFTLRPAAVEAPRVSRRAGWAYGYLRGATALAAVLLALVLSGDLLSRFFAAPAMAPQVVERRVVAERAVVQTVVVEKEVVREKPVVETVVVEVEKATEKAVVEEEARAVAPPVEPAIAAQAEAVEKKAAPEAQPMASPLLQMAQEALPTRDVEKKLQATEVSVEPQATPAPAAPAEAPIGETPSPMELLPEGPAAEVVGQAEGLAAAAPTPEGALTEIAAELAQPSPMPSPADRQVIPGPSVRGLSPLRQLEIGLLAAVIILGAATLMARRGT